MKMRLPLLAAALAVTGAITLFAQEAPIIDKEALIDQIVAVEQRQRAQITDLVFDAEYIELDPEAEVDENATPEARFIKRVYVKLAEDTAFYHEEYKEYYKNGRLQTPGETRKQAEERIEKAQKRKARNISYPMVRPFYPEFRNEYEIAYDGIEEIEDTTCYHFRVVSKVSDDDHINGDYYFETDGFHLVRVDFSPAKLVSKTMFKLSRLDMSITYGPTPEGFWLPEQFEVAGQGKAALLFGVKFAGVEYYRNPQINVGVPEYIFNTSEETDDEQ